MHPNKLAITRMPKVNCDYVNGCGNLVLDALPRVLQRVMPATEMGCHDDIYVRGLSH